MQILDPNLKNYLGESNLEVRKRMKEAIFSIISQNIGKRIAIVSHGTALSYLISKWCDIKLEDDKFKYSYRDKVLLHNYFDYCETFKLTFDLDNNLIGIDHIEL